MANSLVDALIALQLQTPSVKSPAPIRRPRGRKEKGSPSEGARVRRDERRAAATVERDEVRAELRRNSGENVWWKVRAVGEPGPVVEVVEEKAEAPGLACTAIKDALKALKGRFSKQWALALRRWPKYHRRGQPTKKTEAVRVGFGHPPTPYVPCHRGSFVAPIPSAAFDGEDLDPWVFNHDLQMPDSARRDSTEAYRTMAAEAIDAQKSSRSPTTPTGATRLTQFRLGLGPYAQTRTPEGQTACAACGCYDHEADEMCISPPGNQTVEAVTRDYVSCLMAITTEPEALFGSPMDLD